MRNNDMNNEKDTFDAHAELSRIRSRRAEARRKIFRRSRLDKYRFELLAMREAGASFADLQEWLRVERRCKISRSTVARYIKKFQGGK